MVRVRPGVVLLAFLLVVAGCAGPTPAFGPSETTHVTPTNVTATTAAYETTRVTVTRVVDGDTMRVAYPNGTHDTVRLLGVDTPEVGAENTPGEFEGVPDTTAGRQCLETYGQRASEYATDRLADERVTLALDPVADRRDYYGRLLAYVVVDGEQFNYALLREGYARVYDSTFTERDRYEDAERRARDADLGLWACATSTPLPDGGAPDGPLVVASIHADAAGNDHENLNDEYVVFENVGNESLSLGGWTVRDEAGQTYTFPAGARLDPGERLTLYSGSGTDTATAYYWGRDRAVWNNGGDTVTVRDESGAVVARRAY